MATLADIKRLNTASELIKAGLRLSHIVALTDLTPRPLRKMWLETHGKGPPNGKLPESVLSFVHNQAASATISTFITVHLSQFKSVSRIEPEDLVQSWKMVSRLGAPLDINAAYYGLRDLRAGFISFPKCRQCGAHHIFDTGSTLTSRCPFCGNAPY